MSTTSRGTEPGGAVRDLGLPARTVTALTRAGITTSEQLAALTRAELLAVDGLGPGSVAAIRSVVPEPPGRLPAAGRESAPRPPSPEPRPDDEESPAAPPIPSFESLRDRRRRTAIDLIAPATPPPPDPPGTEPPPAGPPRTAPRPPDYADLWRLSVRVGSAVATLPVRLALYAVRLPVRGLRRLVGR